MELLQRRKQQQLQIKSQWQQMSLKWISIPWLKKTSLKATHNVNLKMRHPVVEASTLGGGDTYVVSKTAAASHQHQFVKGSATASSVRKGVFRAKIPIRRKPNPTVANEVRPNAPSRPAAHPKPNAPFRAPQHKPNASTAHGPTVGGSNVTMPPKVSIETMHGASKATTSRFQDFMPTQSRIKDNNK
ncbi:hypothetical protein PIB30_086022 [Stylosanthes scabra]|uniref:Uncharacterized protein n=1 Tax=Stylosanthes scabra TaxID=79078 RepID=A0ABU6SUD2_9FABA|nr:hypothetical protein [Stylosanthes scabra]